jgi:hypothetical protein
MIHRSYGNLCTDVLHRYYSQVVKDWTRWFHYAPSGVHPFLLRTVQGTQLVSLFNSSSCIAIFALLLSESSDYQDQRRVLTARDLRALAFLLLKPLNGLRIRPLNW